MKRMLLVFAILSLLASFSLAQGATVVVNDSNMNGWFFFEETEAVDANGSMVTGPGTPPLGTGSAQLEVKASGDRMILGTLAYQGLRFDAISALSYDSYRSSGGSALALALQFDVDTDLTDANNSWQGRLVYEPYYTQTVSDNTWQTWDTLNPITSGNNWWFSGAPGNAACSIGNPCSWNEMLSAFPNAGVRMGGVTQFKAGGGWTDFVGNVDKFTINTREGETTYDFEGRGGEVPEPATYAMMGAGLVALAAIRRRKKA